MRVKKNYFYFNINNINQAINITTACKSLKIIPVYCIKYYIIQGFGPNWILEFRNLLQKKFNKKNFKILVDCKKNYGLFIYLVKQKFNYLKVTADRKTLLRLKSIADKNKVIVNPKISVIEIKNIKNLKQKLKNISNTNG